MTIKAKMLMQRHPEYDAAYWRRLEAFARGGKELLGNHSIMSDVFPKNRKEHDRVYEERCRRAIYLNYMGEIIGYIVASLFQDKITLSIDGKGKEKSPLPDEYKRFVDDVSRPGGLRLPFEKLLRQQLMCALVKQRSWTLIDMPSSKAGAFASRFEQERAGALNAYAVPLEPESVVDWEEDESGELQWAILYFIDKKRDGLDSSRGIATHRWRFLDRTQIREFAIQVKSDAEIGAEDEVTEVNTVLHGFGRVPLVRSQVPDGLWAADALESPARGHFNHRNNLSWGETQSLLPELYEFLGPEMTGGAVLLSATNPERATAAPRGQGYVQERGAGDSAQFIGPDAGPFGQARESCKDLRDEMHRVLYQMALTVDNSAASLGRSADSKESDKASTAVVLMALGEIVRAHAVDLLMMVATVRKDAGLKFAVEGMTKFDSVNTVATVQVAESLELIKVPSATFQKLHKMQVARAVLGDGATDEDYIAIREELDENIHPEDFAGGIEPNGAVVPPVVP